MFIFPMAEVAIARQCFSRFCGSSRSYGCSHHQRQHETFDGHAFKSNRQKECVQMPGEMARSDPRPSARVTRGAGSGRHLASVLQEGRENANIDAALGFIWGISVKEYPMDSRHSHTAAALVLGLLSAAALGSPALAQTSSAAPAAPSAQATPCAQGQAAIGEQADARFANY